MNELTRPGYAVTEQIQNEVAGQAFSEALFSDWLNYLDAKPKTVQTYTRAIRQFVGWIQEQGIRNPTRQNIREYRDYLAAEGLKPTTVQSYLAAVKQFFNWTAESGIYPNIAKGVKLIEKVDHTAHKHGYLTTKQVKRVLSEIDQGSIKGLRDYAMISLMVTTGLRTVSISLARVEDLGNAGDYAALYYQGKGHSEKDTFVKLSDPVETAIRKYLAARGSVKPSDPLFVSTAHRNNGEAMTTRSISGIVKNRMKAAGIVSDKITAHSLRHTAGTLNIRAGGSLQETMQLLDHKQISTTTIYAHSVEREKSKSEERISGLIFG